MSDPTRYPVRWSALKVMATSPAHYRYYLDAGVTETPAMRIGSRAHNLVLGGKRTFACYDKIRRGKEWDLFRSQHDSDTIMSVTEEGTAQGVARALASDRSAMMLLGGDVEKTIAWNLSGRACAGTPDAVTVGTVTDLKITADANPRRFPYHAARQGWIGQLAWYLDGLRSAEAAHPSLCYIVAVEPKPPHVVTRYCLTERAVESGRRLYRSLFEQLLVCESADVWPGYSQTAIDLDADEELTITLDGEEVNA